MMRPVPSATRLQLEEFWSSNLAEARHRYHRAAGDYGRLLQSYDERRPDLNPPACSTLALTREAESQALAEYMRVLKIFTDLILRGKVPEPRSAAAVAQ